MVEKLKQRNSSTSTDSVDHSHRSIWGFGLLWALVFEAVTLVLRFGMRMESTRDTASTIGRLTCGVRIHHGYIGLAMILLACWGWEKKPRVSFWLLTIGIGLFVSDMVHHFLVLWPITGSPQFDLVYPS